MKMRQQMKKRRKTKKINSINNFQAECDKNNKLFFGEQLPINSKERAERE
jgi:hypothetical protein